MANKTSESVWESDPLLSTGLSQDAQDRLAEEIKALIDRELSAAADLGSAAKGVIIRGVGFGKQDVEFIVPRPDDKKKPPINSKSPINERLQAPQTKKIR
jgi:hypothetical protein